MGKVLCRENILSVLNDETLTSNEEIVDSITRELATLTIPKDKYNELSAKYKTLETNFEAYKSSKMTDEEKTKADLEKTKMKSNKTMVENLLLKAGLTSDDYSDE
jgi:hypothetical protein